MSTKATTTSTPATSEPTTAALTPATGFNVNFMRLRHLASAFSIVLFVISVIALSVRSLNLGLDFLGGTQLEVAYSQPANLIAARTALEQAGYEDVVAVYFGSETEVMIRFHGTLEEAALRAISATLSTVAPGAELIEVGPRAEDYEAKLIFSNSEQVRPKLNEILPADIYLNVRPQTSREGELSVFLNVSLSDAALVRLMETLTAAAGAEVTLNYSESVDSAVGEEMLISAMEGLLVALVMIMLYVAVRFQFKFAVGAVVALIHDVVITLGLFALFAWPFDLTVFAAILALIGYSLNDTIVVFDRIRENFRTIRKSTPSDVINISINQTLGRTLATSFTTVLVLVALFVFGGEVIHGFAQALIIGILVGTYSSIYVAANITLLLKVSQDDLAVPVKEGVDLEEISL